MSSNDLDPLRRQIDEIDDALHELLLKRIEVVGRIAEAKGPGGRLAMRPGREAALVRRLLARHQGPFPAAALVRMWREMIGTVTRLQGPFSIAVYLPPDQPGYWDMARDHVGAQVPLRAHGSVQQVLAELQEDATVVGVLPLPSEVEKNPWWPLLASREPNTPNVIARIPFVPMGNSRAQGLDGLLVARLEPEPSGEESEQADRTFLVIECETDVSRSRISAALQKAGLPPFTLAIRHDQPSGPAYLIELPLFMIDGDPRLKALAEAIGPNGLRLVPIGSYAVPVKAG